MENNQTIGLVVLTFVAGVAIGALVVYEVTKDKAPLPPPPPARPLFRELLCAAASGVSSALTAKALA